MEEKKYPIYKFSATWNQDDYKNNGTGFDKMFDHTPTEEELNDVIEKIKKGIIDKYTGVDFITCDYKYIEDETWVLQCFNHFTLNKFNNDNEVIDSFSRFVERKTELIKQKGHYCLMGAEDRYRWEVCHCEHCQKGGWTIINH